MDKQKNFPKNFLWGASTAAHQVEGGNYNNWTVWELENAHELAKTAKHKLGQLPVWEDIKDQAQDPDNYVSGKAVEHYLRFKEDFDLLKSLNLNAFRFSIEWSRIEPREGDWDPEALRHYHECIDELKKRGIEPLLNIWHLTLPVWFADKGGFEKTKNLKHWQRFVNKIADEYGSEINHVITINEPNVYMTYSYMVGEFPPQKTSLVSSIRVYLNLIRAHKLAYKILKVANPKLQIGLAPQLANIQAKRPHNFFDEVATKTVRYLWNWFFLRRVRKQMDFVGINYYFTDYYKGFVWGKGNQIVRDDQERYLKILPGMKRFNASVPLSDLGVYMEPEGLYPILLRVWARYQKPIIITENGVADARDQYRQWWLEQSIIAMERALSEGVDVRGYFHWSLLDNFEWAYGWWPKFGLVEVDRANGMKRTIRPSALWFAGKIKKLKDTDQAR